MCEGNFVFSEIPYSIDGKQFVRVIQQVKRCSGQCYYQSAVLKTTLRVTPIFYISSHFSSNAHYNLCRYIPSTYLDDVMFIFHQILQSDKIFVLIFLLGLISLRTSKKEWLLKYLIFVFDELPAAFPSILINLPYLLSGS